MEYDIIEKIGMRNYLKLIECLKDDVEMRIEKGELVVKFIREKLDFRGEK